MTDQRLIVFVLCVVLLAGCSLPSIGALAPEQATATQMRLGLNGQQPMTVVRQRTLPWGIGLSFIDIQNQPRTDK